MNTRVLVVDDDRLVADTLSMIYNANGYQCEARYSAADGYEYAKQFGPDLMLCDVAMPEESGLQLAHRVGESMPHIRILLLTAYSSSCAQANAQSERTGRMLRVLSKPCRPDDLLRETASMLKLG